MGLGTSVATVTIAAGATGLSTAVNLGAKVLCGIQMPATWVAAALTFQTSYDDGATWVDLYDDTDTEVTIAAPTQGHYLAVDPSTFAGVTFLKIRSGTSALPVNQTATRTLTLVSRKFYAIN